MLFIAHSEVFDIFPEMHLAVAVAAGIDNSLQRPGVLAFWRDAWAGADAAASYGNAQSHPRVAPWRERFRAIGVSPKEFPSSIEALLRRAMKKGEPFSINPLVDFYNSISLRYVVPAGGFDLRQIVGPLELRISREGDEFMALDESEPVPVAPGEVCIADGSTALTRHFVWRQSRVGLITETTTEVFLVSEVLGEVGREVAEAVLSEFKIGLERYFGVSPRIFLLHREENSASW